LKSLFTDFISSQKKNQSYTLLFTVVSHHNHSLKSLFTDFISSQKKLKLYVTIHSFYLITTIVWGHCSHFLSHNNYSLKSLFTVFISSQLHLWVTIHSLFFSSQLQLEVTIHSFVLSTPTTWSDIVRKKRGNRLRTHTRSYLVRAASC
jgi:hypothetical protein